MAAAVSSYYGPEETILDPEIGLIKFYIKAWGINGNSMTFTQLKTRPCSADEINLGENYDSTKSNFYPVHPTYEKDLNYHANIM